MREAFLWHAIWQRPHLSKLIKYGWQTKPNQTFHIIQVPNTYNELYQKTPGLEYSTLRHLSCGKSQYKKRIFPRIRRKHIHPSFMEIAIRCSVPTGWGLPSKWQINIFLQQNTYLHLAESFRYDCNAEDNMQFRLLKIVESKTHITCCTKILLGFDTSMILQGASMSGCSTKRCVKYMNRLLIMKYKADSSLATSQIETTLQSNTVSDWLEANLDSAAN